MANHVIPLERAFHALSDPTRLAVVGRLSRLGPAAVGVLAEPFDMALPTFLQHIKVLEGAGLIRSRKTGRTRVCEIEPAQILAAEAWLTQVRGLWDSRHSRLAYKD